jgi:hypothetical protein
MITLFQNMHIATEQEQMQKKNKKKIKTLLSSYKILS